MIERVRQIAAEVDDETLAWMIETQESDFIRYSDVARNIRKVLDILREEKYARIEDRL